MQSVIASETAEGSFVSYQTLCSTPLLRLVRAARPAIRSRLTSADLAEDVPNRTTRVYTRFETGSTNSSFTAPIFRWMTSTSVRMSHLKPSAVEESSRGTVVTKKVSCGKDNCKCPRGELHGPYKYIVHRQGNSLEWTTKVQSIRRVVDIYSEDRLWGTPPTKCNQELLHAQVVEPSYASSPLTTWSSMFVYWSPPISSAPPYGVP